ncbi:uncharacterized protein VDAG_07655 [Verticillium dahliae VdLs.17]|uniref:Uncharacterized protein n=1 Tax=Verticillium dahliae (strain VdLs.17 / ATCC MYA-4575 / FGSC 10137) TaxID=498257 RepID=G2XBX3_VERDV|nr:uncharacterized protein VDAG_07655 [Verticillium dahliae VdLs.17]EGY16491.1 hypothetical protein VDAG_07655 [Verticillium dahliae VdLs.17]KAF3349469.1 DNA repair protein RAD5 [Verticillium dahliae VDG2]KAH6699217.1 hypothetical protein EV126DRAFT_342905 [Verticillium dahliae]
MAPPRDDHLDHSKNRKPGIQGSRNDNDDVGRNLEVAQVTVPNLPDDLLSGQAPPLPDRRVNRQQSQPFEGQNHVIAGAENAGQSSQPNIPSSSSERQTSGGFEGLLQDNNIGIMIRTQENLVAHIEFLTARTKLAEERQARAEHALEEGIRSRIDLNEKLRKIESFPENLEETKKENEALKEQLRDAQSHIFSLQPYRQDVTPEEVGRQYADLVNGISDWVAQFMSPWLDHHQESLEIILNGLRHRPGEAAMIKHALSKSADLVHATKYPDTDEDVVISLILRHLNDHIFQKTLYGIFPDQIRLLQAIERAMQATEPKRDLFATRTWIAEAYTALINMDEFRSKRQKRETEIAEDLATLLGIFCSRDQIDGFRAEFIQQCVRPAMNLYEKILISTHIFYLDPIPYVAWVHGSKGDVELSSSFWEHVAEHKLECKNVLQNRKKIDLRKLSPEPTKRELCQNLEVVCMVAPSMCMRQIGRQNTVREPDLVCKQQMLVAWGSVEKRIKFRGGDQTLISAIWEVNKRESRAGCRWA